LLLEKNYSNALSWVIDIIGDLKDEDLEVFAATEALQQINHLTQEEAHQKVFELLGVPSSFEQTIVEIASTFVQNYIKNNLLN